MSSDTFTSNRLAELTADLNDDQGQAWARGMGAVQDDLMGVLRVAAVSRLPALCPDDALDYVGKWINIRRNPGEPHGDLTSGYRGRLIVGWQTWIKAGAPQSIIDSLHAYGIEDVEVYQDYEGAFMPGDWFSRFWVVLGPTMPFDPLLLGSWTLGTGTLGSSATVEQVKAIKRQVLKLKASHSYPVAIVLRFDATDPPVGMDTTIGASIMGGGTDYVRWDLGRIFGLDTFMPFTLGGYNL